MAHHKFARLAAALRERMREETGAATVFTIVAVLTMMLVAGLVLDGGLALSSKTQALDVAQAAARAGASELDLSTYRTDGNAELDPGRAELAAEAWLHRAGIDGYATATTESVSVFVTASRRTQLLQLVGLTHIDVSASATATPIRGVTGAEP